MHFLHHITSNVDFYCCFSHWLNLKNIFALNFSGTTLVSSLQFYQKVVDGFVVWCELIQLQLSIEKGVSSGLEKIEDSYHSCILYEGWWKWGGQITLCPAKALFLYCMWDHDLDIFWSSNSEVSIIAERKILPKMYLQYGQYIPPCTLFHLPD